MSTFSYIKKNAGRSLMALGILSLSFFAAGCQGADAASNAAVSHEIQSPVERGQYLVTVAGCGDCHTPFKMGANGPEPDLSRMLLGPPRGHDDAARPGGAGSLDLVRRGHQHRLRRPLGRHLRAQPDAGQGDRPRDVDRGPVPARDAHGQALGTGGQPADPAADALAELRPDRTPTT